MRLIGLLSWYSERPSWLAGCIASYHAAGIDHLVAVDGAYSLFPDAQPRSTGPEHDTIIETCNGLNLPLTLVIPNQPWAGDEVEKRTAMFRHGDAVSDPDRDWYIVIDADELITRARDGWKDQLDDSPYLAAEAMLWERDTLDAPGKASAARAFSYDPRTAHPIRKLFRASHGIHCRGNHYTYVTKAGEVLWGHVRLEHAEDMTDDLVIEHRSIHRAQFRRAASTAYYARRDATGTER